MIWHATDRRARLLTILVLGTLSLAGCTSVNRELNDISHPIEQRAGNQTRSVICSDVRSPDANPVPVVAGPTTPLADLPEDARDEWFIGIAVSGGGSRSANFSAACFFELQRLGLLQQTDYISSVSGGSLTAAYYCLSDEEWNPQNVQQRLTHAFASDLTRQVFLMPWNWFPLAFTHWDRSDLLARSFRRHLFTRDGHELTYGDLRQDRPRLLINATDLQSGAPFVFCNESFDELNSDLAKYPMAYAVAASASFPVLVHQVTLRDHSTIFKQYRHLIDGGIADNLGVKTLVDAYWQRTAALKQLGGEGFRPYRRGAILLVIDAGTQFDTRLSQKGDTEFWEGIRNQVELSATALVNRASSATLAEAIVESARNNTDAQTLRQQKLQLEETGCLKIDDHEGRPVYVFHIALSRVRSLQRLPHRSFWQTVNAIPTDFNISNAEAHSLYQAAQLLFREKFDAALRPVLDRNRGPTTTEVR